MQDDAQREADLSGSVQSFGSLPFAAEPSIYHLVVLVICPAKVTYSSPDFGAWVNLLCQ